MTKFEDDFEEDFTYWEPERVEERRLAMVERAKSEPTFDVFSEAEEFRPKQPKFQIGQYVAEQGFKVPLITEQADWERSFDDGTAMLRSEMPQDYGGLSGLLSSERLIHSPFSEERTGFNQELGSLIMRGLRSGELDPTDYMTYFKGPMGWSERHVSRILSAMGFGFKLNEIYSVTASKWRYVEGDNISIFADPNVEGRYHFGVTPREDPDKRWQPIGSYQFEPGEHEIPQTFRKHDQPFIAKPFVEYYEQIRNLPFFDTTNCPVLELQLDPEGNIHFLQYLKTPQKQEFVDPFELPYSEETLILNNVRGITPPEGEEMKLYIAPSRFTRKMSGEAIFLSFNSRRGPELQLASRVVKFILHRAYISFQDNHFDSAPLYSPPLAAGMDGSYERTSNQLFEKLDTLLEEGTSGPYHFLNNENVAYLDIKVTSNGREAAIESDWELKGVAYSDIS